MGSMPTQTAPVKDHPSDHLCQWRDCPRRKNVVREIKSDGTFAKQAAPCGVLSISGAMCVRSMGRSVPPGRLHTLLFTLGSDC